MYRIVLEVCLSRALEFTYWAGLSHRRESEQLQRIYSARLGPAPVVVKLLTG